MSYSGRTIVLATDSLGDCTVSFQLVEKHAQAHMNACLQTLKDHGLAARVVMSDGSPLYTDALQRYGADVEPPRCLFHVLKEVNKLLCFR